MARFDRAFDEAVAELTKTYGVKALASNAEAAADAHVVVLSVKPQVLATVMRELRGKLDEEKLVISIVAGATLYRNLDHAFDARLLIDQVRRQIQERGDLKGDYPATVHLHTTLMPIGREPT